MSSPSAWPDRRDSPSDSSTTTTSVAVAVNVGSAANAPIVTVPPGVNVTPLVVA